MARAGGAGLFREPAGRMEMKEGGGTRGRGAEGVLSRKQPGEVMRREAAGLHCSREESRGKQLAGRARAGQTGWQEWRTPSCAAAGGGGWGGDRKLCPRTGAQRLPVLRPRPSL